MKHFKRLLFITIIKTQLRSLKIFNIIIILNILKFNIIKCAIKSLMKMLTYNTFLLRNKSLTTLLKFFIKTKSNYFANLLTSNYVLKVNKI